MLDREFMIGTCDGAFQQTPDVLDPIGMNVTPDIFFGAMVDDLMLGVVIADPSISSPIVGDDHFGIKGRVLLDEAVERPPIRPVNHLQSYFSASLNHADDHSFILEIGSASFPFSFQFPAE